MSTAKGFVVVVVVLKKMQELASSSLLDVRAESLASILWGLHMELALPTHFLLCVISTIHILKYEISYFMNLFAKSINFVIPSSIENSGRIFSYYCPELKRARTLQN